MALRDSLRCRYAHVVIFTWRYELVPRVRLSALAGSRPRRGALIRVDGGFADVHPWPELGDLDIDEQLALLGRGKTTGITAASLRFAAIDAEARRRGVSLFAGLVVPESHWLWQGGEVPPAFDTLKIKMSAGEVVDPELAQYRLRLDYNAALAPDDLLSQDLPRQSVEFIEDPCPYDEVAWRNLRAAGFRLALDRAAADVSQADVLVIKPAVQDVPDSEKEIVITSYMDHPLGQVCAAWVAATRRTSSRCGLLTHILYEESAFSERLSLDGARLVPPPGTGFGFDDLLEQLPWARLN